MYDVIIKNINPTMTMASIIVGWLQQEAMDNTMADNVLLKQDPEAIAQLAALCNQKTNIAFIGMHPNVENRRFLLGYLPNPGKDIELIGIDLLAMDGEYKYELVKSDHHVHNQTISILRNWDSLVNQTPQMPAVEVGHLGKSLEGILFEQSANLREAHAEREVLKYFELSQYFNDRAVEHINESKAFQEAYTADTSVFNGTRYPCLLDLKQINILKQCDAGIERCAMILNTIYSDPRFLSARDNVTKLAAINAIVKEIK